MDLPQLLKHLRRFCILHRILTFAHLEQICSGISATVGQNTSRIVTLENTVTGLESDVKEHDNVIGTVNTKCDNLEKEVRELSMNSLFYFRPRILVVFPV